jgi:hypothetical protein
MGRALRTAEVEVDRSDARAPLRARRCRQHRLRLVARKVRDERRVLRVALEQRDAGTRTEELVRLDHRRVAELSLWVQTRTDSVGSGEAPPFDAVRPHSMPAGQQAEGELAAADHRSQDELVRRQWPPRRRQRHRRRRRQRHGRLVVAWPLAAGLHSFCHRCRRLGLLATRPAAPSQSMLLGSCRGAWGLGVCFVLGFGAPRSITSVGGRRSHRSAAGMRLSAEPASARAGTSPHRLPNARHGRGTLCVRLAGVSRAAGGARRHTPSPHHRAERRIRSLCVRRTALSATEQRELSSRD